MRRVQQWRVRFPADSGQGVEQAIRALVDPEARTITLTLPDDSQITLPGIAGRAAWSLLSAVAYVAVEPYGPSMRPEVLDDNGEWQVYGALTPEAQVRWEAEEP